MQTPFETESIFIKGINKFYTLHLFDRFYLNILIIKINYLRTAKVKSTYEI